jgi:hypothetical protein
MTVLIILPHIAYGRESWLLILRTKHEIYVSINEVFRKIIETKGFNINH